MADDAVLNQGVQIQSQAPLPPSCVIVIFGAAGDLTKRLLIPALYNLSSTGLMPESYAIIGVDIANKDTEVWRAELRSMLNEFISKGSGEKDHNSDLDVGIWQRISGTLKYIQGDFNDPKLYKELATPLRPCHHA